jgi:gamma-tubulin complex component 5
LQPAAKKIFNTGKSIIFLKELGIHGSYTKNTTYEPHLDHATVCGISNEVPLSPFPELFQAAFEDWMQSKYSQASSVLRQHLVDNDGLIRTLFIFETLYLGKNGAVFEDFANALLERMDAGRKGWNDRYVLTEITRSIFGTVMSLSDAEKIVVRSSKAKNASHSIKDLATISLDFALPWPIQNIIQRSSIPTYQQLFTFLLQTYRVKYMLQRIRSGRGTSHKDPATQLARKLRHCLTWFTDILRSYLTETAIFFTTQEMNTYMEKAEDIDVMAQVHIKYVAKLQERALLSKDVKPIHKAIMDVLDLGVLFAKTVANEDTGEKQGTVAGKTRSTRQNDIAPDSATVELSDPDVGEYGQDDRFLKSPQSITQQSLTESLRTMASEFTRLLPFIIAGLKSVGRVGAEPMWEQLAERLEWKDKKPHV